MILYTWDQSEAVNLRRMETAANAGSLLLIFIKEVRFHSAKYNIHYPSLQAYPLPPECKMNVFACLNAFLYYSRNDIWEIWEISRFSFFNSSASFHLRPFFWNLYRFNDKGLFFIRVRKSSLMFCIFLYINAELISFNLSHWCSLSYIGRFESYFPLL